MELLLMEGQNVAAGYYLNGLWAASYEHILRRGYAWRARFNGLACISR
jgi:hypothetical protein